MTQPSDDRVLNYYNTKQHVDQLKAQPGKFPSTNDYLGIMSLQTQGHIANCLCSSLE